MTEVVTWLCGLCKLLPLHSWNGFNINNPCMMVEIVGRPVEVSRTGQFGLEGGNFEGLDHARLSKSTMSPRWLETKKATKARFEGGVLVVVCVGLSRRHCDDIAMERLGETERSREKRTEGEADRGNIEINTCGRRGTVKKGGGARETGCGRGEN
ncbi:hypothetical protein Fmac_004919 [Flemingia macrophylla]|uniref:Uncharacterized protein n=1 Tax=Flemingia macrophylla TaxID=520843 RepID=A0ABD1N6G1_9FABA